MNPLEIEKDLLEEISDEQEQAEKNGEIRFEDDMTEQEWFELKRKCKEQPQYYIDMDDRVWVLPDAPDYSEIPDTEEIVKSLKEFDKTIL